MTTKERPKNFKDWEVLALLENRKTQFREIVDLTKYPQYPDDLESLFAIFQRFPHQQGCPLGKIGDRIWGRETFCIECDSEWSEWHGETFFSDISPKEWADGSSLGIYYPATDPKPVSEREEQWRKYSSAQMPRKASRILREITDIRIERLGEISEEDAIAEGIEPTYMFLGVQRYKNYLGGSNDLTAPASFASLQNYLYGKDYWETNKNKWAWVVTVNPNQITN